MARCECTPCRAERGYGPKDWFLDIKCRHCKNTVSSWLHEARAIQPELRWTVFLAGAINGCHYGHCPCTPCWHCWKCANRRCAKRTLELCAHCKRCATCCACLHCKDCKSPITWVCPRCRNGPCCCECIECGACGARFEREVICRRCGRCQANCCRCVTCEGCREPFAAVCRSCTRCPTCCLCGSDDALDGDEAPTVGGERAKVRYVNAPIPIRFHLASRTEKKRNASPRFIAAEIEVASVDTNPLMNLEMMVQLWGAAIVHDGSLPPTGFEICTAPAAGDKFCQQIDAICESLARAGARVTGACGLHVHVDARDCSYYDIRRLVQVYAAIEDTLFAMVPPARRTARFCLPCAQRYLATIGDGRLPYKAAKEKVIQGIYGRGTLESEAGSEAQKLRKKKYLPARYAAVNLHSWMYRGTIECRMFGGTVKAHKIIAWGKLWARIMDYVVARTDDEVRRVLNVTRGAELLHEIVAGDVELTDFVTARLARHANP